MNPTNKLRIVPVIAATFLCVSCVSGFKSNEPLTQTYVLQPQQSADSAVPTAAGSLQVQLDTSGTGLGTDGIVLRRPGGRQDFYSGARWASSAPQMLQTQVEQALRTQGRYRLVQAQGDPFGADWLLHLDVTQFEADYAGEGAPTINVTMVASFGHRSDRDVSQFTVTGSAPAQADRMQAVIAAFDQATVAALIDLQQKLAALPQ